MIIHSYLTSTYDFQYHVRKAINVFDLEHIDYTFDLLLVKQTKAHSYINSGINLQKQTKVKSLLE